MQSGSANENAILSVLTDKWINHETLKRKLGWDKLGRGADLNIGLATRNLRASKQIEMKYEDVLYYRKAPE